MILREIIQIEFNTSSFDKILIYKRSIAYFDCQSTNYLYSREIRQPYTCQQSVLFDAWTVPKVPPVSKFLWWMNQRSEAGVQYYKIDGGLRYFRLNCGYQLNISQLAYHVWSYQIYSKEYKNTKQNLMKFLIEQAEEFKMQ
ncbi:Hypothetical_protein [Hexamita inflata]|uniref:Hypothetical_protein n=1 Tax=Hexamita inflata TaxID=28002 RepID=A0ABP1GDN9_9EUKA